QSVAQHATICVENSADVFDARILAKKLKEEIAYRVRQYSYCIMNNTTNYKEWLEDDYERKLRSRISQKFAGKIERALSYYMDRKVLIIGYVWPEPATTAAGIRMMQLLLFFLERDCQVTFASTA